MTVCCGCTCTLMSASTTPLQNQRHPLLSLFLSVVFYSAFTFSYLPPPHLSSNTYTQTGVATTLQWNKFKRERERKKIIFGRKLKKSLASFPHDSRHEWQNHCPCNCDFEDNSGDAWQWCWAFNRYVQVWFWGSSPHVLQSFILPFFTVQACKM